MRISWIGGLLCGLAPAAVAETTPAAPPAPPAAVAPTPPPRTRPLTRGEADGYAALSGLFSLGTLGVQLLPQLSIGGVELPAANTDITEALSPVPLALVDPSRFFAVEGWEASFLVTQIALQSLYANSPVARSDFVPLLTTAGSFTLHEALYSTYVTYRDARLQGESPAWTDDWHAVSASELIAAPFHWSNLDHAVVLAGEGSVLGVGALLVGLHYAQSNPGTLQGGPLAENLVLGVVNSFDAGVTEEAIFRGVIYEELELSLSRWPARLVDMTLFTLAHVPGEIAEGQSTEAVIFGLFSRAVFALLAEIAYDQGGLPESSALHSLWDSTLFIAAALSNSSPLGGNVRVASALPPRSTVSSLLGAASAGL